MDQPNVHDLLPLIRDADIETPLDDGTLSYFLSRIEVIPDNAPGMSWRKRGAAGDSLPGSPGGCP
jgi:hypothetical protein